MQINKTSISTNMNTITLCNQSTPRVYCFSSKTLNSRRVMFFPCSRKSKSLNVSQQDLKWALRVSHGVQSPPESSVDVGKLVAFLYEDIQHVFDDDHGIDLNAYDENMKFRDPIIKFDHIRGYIFYTTFLKSLFKPEFHLHWIKQTGPYEISARWIVVMEYILLPWRPELVLSGTSVIGINPKTGKIRSHVDYWDSIQNSTYFSVEGLWDIIKQLLVSKTPNLESAKYHILKRTANYEIRKYWPFICVETNGDKMAGSKGFYDVSGLPDINKDKSQSKRVEGGIAAVLKFSGELTEDTVCEKETVLRASLLRDGLNPSRGCLLARYNDHREIWTLTMRNELLIWLEDFKLDA